MALTITTSKGQTYNVQYAWAPLLDGSCGISLRDDRRLPQIAEDFDGLASIHLVDYEARRQYDFDGYTLLKAVQIQGGVVQLRLEKPILREEVEGHNVG